MNDIDQWIERDPLGSMLRELVEQCRRTSTRIAVAESFTGGLLVVAIASTPDSGPWFEGGAVTYTLGAKRRVLGVEGDRVVDAGTAAAMAARAAELFDADVAIATTGVAGPAPQDGREPGTVVLVAAERRDGHVSAGEPVEHHVDGPPGVVRTAGVALAVAHLLDVVRARPDAPSGAAPGPGRSAVHATSPDVPPVPTVGAYQGVPSDNTTMTAVLEAYARSGWSSDFVVDDADGLVECVTCGGRIEAEHTIVESLRRLEGASDPADMSAVVALQCPLCQATGTAVVRYGPESSPAEAALFARARDGRGSSALPSAAAPGETP
jgi:nicotinamide-nucleotide amidase